MKNRLPLIVGVVVAIIMMVVGGFVISNSGDSAPSISGDVKTLNCIGGSEKSALMADPELKQMLRDKYKIEVNFQKKPSYDLAQIPTDQLKAQKVDCLWPSSNSAKSVFEKNHNTGDFPGYRAESVLESPEVIYAGPDATDTLVKAGVVEQRGNGYYIVDLNKLLLEYVLKRTTWQSLGAKHVAGPVKVTSTDTRSSNSAITLAQLELAVIAGDAYTAPSADDARKALPTLLNLYKTQGLQPEGSDDGFKEWLLQGANTLFAGYENQMLQKLVEYQGNQNAKDELKNRAKLLYPEPTIYNSHPVLALNQGAGVLIDAMKDPAIQDIAWKKFGFRSGTQIGANKASDFPDIQLADQLKATAPPSGEVTLMILECVRTEKCS